MHYEGMEADLERLSHAAMSEIQEAGIRYMAQYWENETDQDKRTVATVAWAVVMTAFARKAEGLIQVMYTGMTEEEFKREFGQPDPVVKARMEEAGKLYRLGEL